MQPLRHSYTNRTLGDGATVVKCYQGPGALTRLRIEHAVLDALQGRVPVPPVLGSGDGCLTMRFLSGTHGQELLDSGHGIDADAHPVDVRCQRPPPSRLASPPAVQAARMWLASL